MKKIFLTYPLAFLFTLGILSSCKDFLDEVPPSDIAPVNFYKTESDALAALTAVYASLQGGGYYGANIIFFNSVNTEEAREGTFPVGEIIALDQNTYNAGTAYFGNAWSDLYRTINLSNSIINRVPAINMDATLRSRIVGEAKFIRAMSYFNLVRMFGKVPLRLEESTDLNNVAMAPSEVSVIYEAIIADLQDAEATLQEGVEAGRATPWAAKTLLAKVYMTLAGTNSSSPYWVQAHEKLSEVIASGKFELLPDFAQVFRPSGKNGKEHIFSIQYVRGGSEASGLNTLFAQQTTPVFNVNTAPNKGYNGFSNVMPEVPFYESFPNTYRKSVTFVTEVPVDAAGNTTPIIGGPHIFKYYDPEQASNSNEGSNFNVLRYADVLLMFAEAENEINGPTTAAYEAINAVRKRARTDAAGVEEVDALPDLAGLTQEAFRDAVLQERAWELSYEGHRRWDLLRTGKYISTLQAYGKPVSEANLVFPYPQREVELNTLLVP